MIIKWMAVLVLFVIQIGLTLTSRGESRKLSEQEQFLRMTGGFLTKPAKGCVAVINLQSAFKTNHFNSLFFPRGRCMKIPFRIYPGTSPFKVEEAEATVKSLGAQAAIFLVENPALPMSLAAPEAEWAMINVAKLTVDNPADYILTGRVDKMFSRAVMQILGGIDYSDHPNCAMHQVNSLKDLDKVKGVSPNVFAMGYMEKHIKRLGIEMERSTTYAAACKEGWAPSPTNDIQRAIWDEIHEIPSKPIKITYDKDRQKPVVK